MAKNIFNVRYSRTIDCVRNHCLNDGVNDDVNRLLDEGATKGVKEKLIILLTAVAENEGKRVPDYKGITQFPDSTMESYIKRLKEADLIEFRGDAPQTGGYYLTKKMKENLI
jgi:hypothetical protein